MNTDARNEESIFVYASVLVVGRVDGDDEDGYSIYHVTTLDKAIEQFKEEMAELNDTTVEDIDTKVYINLVVGTDDKFDVLLAN